MLSLVGGFAISSGGYFLDLNLSISNGLILSKLCDKRNELAFNTIVPFPCFTSQLIWFTRVSSHVAFNVRNKTLIDTLLR